MFESLIVRTGFQALAPCLALLEALMAGYGQDLHPRSEEHTANLWSWMGHKLLLPLRKVPLTATGGDRDYAWNDWEQARRNEQIRATLREAGITEIRFWPDLNEPDFCEDCGSPLYPNGKGEIVHADMPEDIEPETTHFH